MSRGANPDGSQYRSQIPDANPCLSKCGEVLRVCLHTDARNANASRAAIESIGGKFEGILRAHRMAADFIPRDSVRYSIIASGRPGGERTFDSTRWIGGRKSCLSIKDFNAHLAAFRAYVEKGETRNFTDPPNPCLADAMQARDSRPTAAKLRRHELEEQF